eukprot:TRINITY_DN32105_c0_g1_i1.p2 TRINITY_DN32105_c0_g1~~TRINITY_DN32105_c0_g1_i1.p2  ORF type:complete len:386 (+),score=135.01 TRINITY_DN32105_c0_g1_i1:73-1158(+)
MGPPRRSLPPARQLLLLVCAAGLGAVMLSWRRAAAEPPEHPAPTPSPPPTPPLIPPRTPPQSAPRVPCEWGPGLWCANGSAAAACRKAQWCANAGTGERAAEQLRVQNWHRLRRGLREDADRRGADRETAPRLLFMGDSITEALRGTSIGRPKRSYYVKQQPQLFGSVFGKARPLALGIGADQTQHLLYRMLQGELSALRSAPIRAAVLLIGTNNIGAGLANDKVADGIAAVARMLCHILPSGVTLFALSVLPRADCQKPDRKRGCVVGRAPNRMLAAVDEVNAVLPGKLEGSCPEGSRLRVLDCGRVFRLPAGGVDTRLMPDALHPGPDGYRKWWGECLLPELRRIFPELPESAESAAPK